MGVHTASPTPHFRKTTDRGNLLMVFYHLGFRILGRMLLGSYQMSGMDGRWIQSCLSGCVSISV